MRRQAWAEVCNAQVKKDFILPCDTTHNVFCLVGMFVRMEFHLLVKIVATDSVVQKC